MKDLKKAKDKDLIKELKSLEEKNEKIKFSSGSGISKDSFQRRKNRKEIARILTELNNRKKNN